MPMLRKAVVDGQFYPASATGINAMLETLIEKDRKKVDAVGALVPHAGYVYSGAVAGAVFSRLEEEDSYIIIGPNHTGRGKPFAVMAQGLWQTPLGEVEIDAKLAQAVLKEVSPLEEDSFAHQREHSIEVQLPFLQYIKPDIKLVPIVIAQGDTEDYVKIGKAIAAAVKKTGKKALVLASGDMTHYEPQATAEAQDKKAIEAILKLDTAELTSRYLRDSISMCAYAPVMVMLAAAKELGARQAELVRYRTSGDASGDFSSVVGYAGIIVSGGGKKRSALVELAWQAVESKVRENKIYRPAKITKEMEDQAGVFVSLKKKGRLRGCIGTFLPCQDNIAQEIVVNAISAATADPRFPPVSIDELDELKYSVDVLTPPQKIEDTKELDVKKYGVIVETDFKKGLLLPDLEGVDTVEEQLSIAAQKAGIRSDEPYIIYRFEVKRHT